MIRQTNPTILISDVIRDPVLAKIFRNAERDGLVGAEIERPKTPAPGAETAQVREFEFA